MHKKNIFTGMKVLLADKWVADQAIITEGTKIIAIIPETMIAHHSPAQIYRFPKEYLLIPGGIDLHIHGANGYDVMDATAESLQGISQALAYEGVTGFLATTMTMPTKRIELALQCIADTELSGAQCLGVHLEGPFISEKKLGAQAAHTLLPDSKIFAEWQEIAKGKIRIVTIAPELTGALEFIKHVKEMGVIVSIGHTNASCEQVMAAIDAGASQATHLFNAMASIQQRNPGPIVPLLLSERISAEIIVDDVHLHPAIVKLIYRLKQKEKLFLITDGIRAKCLQDGVYEFGGQTVHVDKQIAKLKDGTLAGSVLTLMQAVQNMQQDVGCELADAIYMATTGPCHALGLAANMGCIENNYDANLVVLDNAMQVKLTMCNGIIVYENS